MTDEEKQALKVVNKRTERLIEELKIEEEDLIDEPKIAYLITQIEVNKTLVNLIEKQSKEIEELKGKNNGLEIKANELYNLADVVKRDYIHKDKIKAKIKEFKIIRDTIIKNKKYFNSPMMIYDLKRYDYCEKMLQSLLEKE